MKKKIVIITLIGCAFLCVGCNSDQNADTNQSDNNNTKLTELSEQVTSLSNQVGTIEEKVTSFLDSYQTNTANNTENNINNSQNINTEDLQLPVDFTDYKKRSEEIKTNVKANKDTNIDTFHLYKKQINELEQELDILDEQLEQAFQNGTMTKEEYADAEKKLDSIEDINDAAEQLLEKQFDLEV